MAIQSNGIIDKINAMLATATKADDIATLSAAKYEIENSSVSFPDLASLPPASKNVGRLVWVDSIKDYRTSDGATWNRYFSSTFVVETNTIWAWGCNGQGRLGDGTITNNKSPVSVIGGFTDWCQASAGFAHTTAVRSNGTAWAWGCNNRGQIGDNTTVSKSSPVSVVGGFTDWCQISAGFVHTAAIRTNGTMWAWGCNGQGRLGDGTAVNKSSPVSVVGGFTDWCQTSAGNSHSAAIRTNGTLWAWGCNGSGRLGDNSIITQSSPVSVVGGFTDWCQVSVGCGFTAAVRTNGTIWSWGNNLSGNLGDSTTTDKSSPVSVVSGFTDWCQISAGFVHTAAVRTNGTIWSWGCNGYGRLGDNSTVNKSSPVSVVGGFTDWCQVSSGSIHGVAVRANGTLWGWGNNLSGNLGDSTTTDKSSPVSVIGGFTGWCQVSAGNNNTFAVNVKSRGF